MGRSTSEVYDIIKERITSGEYAPAQSLTELALSSELGVSRNTLKKVLVMLQKDNLVTFEINKSAKVKAFTLEEVLACLELREVLEGFVTRNTVMYISDERVEELSRILSEMKNCLESNDLLGYSEENRRFHNVIYDSCRNRVAVEMILSLKTQMARYNVKTILIPNRDKQSYAEHEAIYHAVKSRNPDLAEVLISKHISNVRKVLAENYTLLFRCV